ncbi:MAG: phage major capsid protein [Myxococcales bacterium]|nr:phage major capsid protein [Myxococcales bacterium]
MGTHIEEEGGTLSAEARQLLDAVSDRAREIAAEEIEKANARYEAMLAERDAKIEALRKALNEGNGRPGGTHAERKSFARTLLDSDQWKKRQDGERRMHDVELGNALGQLHRNITRMIKTRSLTTSTTPLSQIPFDPEIAYADRFRQEGVIDLVPMLRTGKNQIQYPRRNVYYDLRATMAAAQTSGNNTITLTNARGVVVGSTLTLDPKGDANGPEDRVVQSVNLETNVVTLTTNLGNNHALGTVVVANEYAPTAETKEGPRFYIAFERVTVNVKKIMTLLKLSSEVLDDEERLEDELNMDMPDAQRRSLSKQLLYGNGSGDEFTGILNTSGIQSITWSTQSSGTTKRDLIRRAIKALRSSERAPTALLLNPDEMCDLDLEKGNDGHYIEVGMDTDGEGNARVWRVPVVETTEITSGTGLLANFEYGCRAYDRQQDTIDMTDSDGDDFSEDMVTFRAKRRLAFSVREPKAFVRINFDAAPAA